MQKQPGLPDTSSTGEAEFKFDQHLEHVQTLVPLQSRGWDAEQCRNI
jgi:hypothetical protein